MRTSTWCLAAATALTTTTMQARQLTPAEAIESIEYTQTSQAPPQNGPAVLLMSVDGPSSRQPAVYVFSREGGGFYVTAADDCAGRILLGYSDIGEFRADGNPTIEWWLGEYAATIDRLRGSGQERKAPEAGRDNIDPLTRTLWNQDAPYNDLCPYPASGGTERCPTGCVATAMSQVMKVHSWPPKGSGTHSYVCRNVGEELSFDFGSTTFDWDNMLDSYPEAGNPDDISRKAVATLMYAVGVSIDMNYGPRGSGSNYFEGVKALLDYFDYDKGMQVLERDYYTLDDWTAMIYGELQAGRPVLYGGQNSEDGHAFVIDGYQDPGYFHLNWGWGGTSNGYFLVTALDPLVQGIGGSSSGYNIGQTMIIGVRPSESGSEIVPSLKFVGGFAVEQELYDRDESREICFYDLKGIFNGAIDSMTITPGIRLVGSDGRDTWLKSTETMSLLYEEGFRGYDIPVADFPSEGIYTVYPAFTDASGNWHDARVALDCVGSLVMTVTPQTISFSRGSTPELRADSLTLDTEIVPGCQFSLTAVLSVSGGGEYYGPVHPALMSHGVAVATATPIAVDIKSGQRQRCVWISEFPDDVDPGEYLLILATAGGTSVSDPIDVTVGQPSADTPEIKATIHITNRLSGTGTLSDPDIVAGAELKASMTVEGVAGFFAGMVSGYVFYSDNRLETPVTAGFVGLRPGESDTIDFTVATDMLEKDHTYMLCPWTASSGQIGEPICFRLGSRSVVEQTEAYGSLAVRPNPMLECVEVSSSRPLAEVAVLSLGGAEAMRVVVDRQPSVTVDVGMLSAGFYILEAVYADGSVEAIKVVKR